MKSILLVILISSVSLTAFAQEHDATNPTEAIYGYYYEYKYANKDRFKLKATPAIKAKTGGKTFVLDETGRIIDAETGVAISL